MAPVGSSPPMPSQVATQVQGCGTSCWVTLPCCAHLVPKELRLSTCPRIRTGQAPGVGATRQAALQPQAGQEGPQELGQGQGLASIGRGVAEDMAWLCKAHVCPMHVPGIQVC